jgi:very-short-patch-repair endonuclease
VLTQQQLEQCRVSCKQQVRAGKTSQTQLSVFAALQCLRDTTWQQQPALEQPIADETAKVDIVAVTAGGRQLAIEVDGPSHFVQPGNQLNGPTQDRNSELAALGYTVVSIPYWEWDCLRDEQQQVEYLQRKLAVHL